MWKHIKEDFDNSEADHVDIIPCLKEFLQQFPNTELLLYVARPIDRDQRMPLGDFVRNAQEIGPNEAVILIKNDGSEKYAITH